MIPARMTDLSLGGASLRVEGVFEPGQAVTILLAQKPTVTAEYDVDLLLRQEGRGR